MHYIIYFLITCIVHYLSLLDGLEATCRQNFFPILFLDASCISSLLLNNKLPTNVVALKSANRLAHSSLQVRSLAFAQLDSLPRVSQGWYQGVGQVGFLPGGPRHETISKFILLDGRIQFLAVVAEVSMLHLLSARALAFRSKRPQKPPTILWYIVPQLSTYNGTLNPYTSNPSYFPFFPYLCF